MLVENGRKGIRGECRSRERLHQLVGELIPNYPEESRDAGWRAFWARLRAAPDAVGQRFIAEGKRQIRVRRRDGAWVFADAVLPPGALVRSDDATANQNVLVDAVAHSEDAALLAAFPTGNPASHAVALKSRGNGLSPP